MNYHPIANLFPMMNEQEYKVLREDLHKNGFRPENPIIIINDMILDGRNRYKAAIEENITPIFKKYIGDNPLDFVISQNLHRRHLNESQRAMIAVRMANMERGGDRPSKNDANFDSANLPNGISQIEAAQRMNISERLIRSAKKIKEKAPELVQLIESNKMTINDAEKRIKEKETIKYRQEIANIGASLKSSDLWHVELSDIHTYQTEKKFDFIITDPPYSKEYLPLYEVLAQRTKEWLIPEGLLMIMCGNSYINKIYEIMDNFLVYYWTAVYLTPGQSVSLRQKQVNTNWKPLLIYSITNNEYKGKIFSDVFVSDKNEKDYHQWGQSESGMFDIISKICLPGQSIFDPFCGTSTTGVAALKHGCIFTGIDLDEQAINISKKRLYDSTKNR